MISLSWYNIISSTTTLTLLILFILVLILENIHQQYNYYIKSSYTTAFTTSCSESSAYCLALTKKLSSFHKKIDLHTTFFPATLKYTADNISASSHNNFLRWCYITPTVYFCGSIFNGNFTFEKQVANKVSLEL